MPTIKSEVTISADLDAVYALAKDVEKFPEFMPEVEEVTVLERRVTQTVTHWVGRIKEFNRTIEWTEEDEWDDAKRLCTFKQTQGDFTKYEGIWTFASEGPGTRVELILDYEYDIPLIGPLIKGLLKKKTQQNCDSMLKALKDKLEAEPRL